MEIYNYISISFQDAVHFLAMCDFNVLFICIYAHIYIYIMFIIHSYIYIFRATMSTDFHYHSLQPGHDCHSWQAAAERAASSSKQLLRALNEPWILESVGATVATGIGHSPSMYGVL